EMCAEHAEAVTLLRELTDGYRGSAAQPRTAEDDAAQGHADQDRAAQPRAAEDDAARDRADQDRADQDRAARERAAQDRTVQARLGGAQRRLALAHELLGQWDAALTVREAAAVAFAAAGQPAEAAVERLAAAAHLRSAASFPAALDTLAAARPDAESSRRADLPLRIDGPRGDVLARRGRGRGGNAPVRASPRARPGPRRAG